MRKSIVAAAVLATTLAIGAPAQNAAAMPTAAPAPLGLAAKLLGICPLSVLGMAPPLLVGLAWSRMGVAPRLAALVGGRHCT